MAKKLLANVKLQIKGGEANPSPPIGPALGQHGVNIAEFCKAFNAKTQAKLEQPHIVKKVSGTFTGSCICPLSHDQANVGYRRSKGSGQIFHLGRVHGGRLSGAVRP